MHICLLIQWPATLLRGRIYVSMDINSVYISIDRSHRPASDQDVLTITSGEMSHMLLNEGLFVCVTLVWVNATDIATLSLQLAEWRLNTHTHTHTHLHTHT